MPSVENDRYETMNMTYNRLQNSVSPLCAAFERPIIRQMLVKRPSFQSELGITAGLRSFSWRCIHNANVGVKARLTVRRAMFVGRWISLDPADSIAKTYESKDTLPLAKATPSQSISVASLLKACLADPIGFSSLGSVQRPSNDRSSPIPPLE